MQLTHTYLSACFQDTICALLIVLVFIVCVVSCSFGAVQSIQGLRVKGLRVATHAWRH